MRTFWKGLERFASLGVLVTGFITLLFACLAEWAFEHSIPKQKEPDEPLFIG